MKILVFNPSYPPVACGVGDYNRGLAAALVRAGHEVTVITCAWATTAGAHEGGGEPAVIVADAAGDGRIGGIEDEDFHAGERRSLSRSFGSQPSAQTAAT